MLMRRCACACPAAPHSALAPHGRWSYACPVMPPPNDIPPAQGSAGASRPDLIPPRRQHRAARKSNIPPQPSIRRHFVRLLVATAIGALVMFILLMMAMRYAQRDWSLKNQKAHAWRIQRPAPETPAAAPDDGPEGRAYVPPPRAAHRYLRRLSADPLLPSPWLIYARAFPDPEHPRRTVAALRLAMAADGESAGLRNDLGAAYLRQRRVHQAAAQFEAALRIRPGFPPALYNLALCAIADRDPARASSLLGQYLARRPTDSAAYRLQSSLLSQLGRQAEALALLEKFLRNQPPHQPLFLEAAVLSARLGNHGNALRYLETALAGNSIQSVVRAYQSPAFRNIRLSGQGDALANRIANRARVALGAPVPVDDIRPLLATPNAILR
jgi:tetratricopeptide (TPR) repeat protein